MRRFPFYSYPSPAQASFHRPHPSSPAPRPAPTPRSVINIPVFDSAPSRSSFSPPQLRPFTSPPASPAVPLIDPSSAAIIVQSHFRGFCVRRHRPLLLLRSIAKARKQLEELQSELESPGFPLKVRASEKERLRFSESVMAIILRLDAIEGSMAEVRSQRKEATKMAIKLQDAIDAIAMQKNEITAGGMAPDDDTILFEQSEDPLCPDVNMVQGEACTEGIMDVNTMQEESTSPEDDVADKFVPNLDKDKDDVMDMAAENVSPLQPLKVEDVGQQRESGELLRSESGPLELVPQVKPAKAMYDPEQNISHVTEDNAGSDAAQVAEEELNNGIDALHLEGHKNQMQNHALVAKVDQETFVDDMIVASHGFAEKKSFDGSYTCMDVVQEVKGGLSQDAETCPGTPRAEDKCDYPSGNTAHQDQLQGPTTAPERMTESNCSSDSKGSPTLLRHGYEERSDEAHENRSDVANFCEEVKAQSSPLSMAGTPSIDDSTVLHQLSEDCRQLKSLVGKLLVQNKAQSNILCALGERLEMLEHQQQLNCQRNQRKTREKRKLKKGSKRSVRCRNCE